MVEIVKALDENIDECMNVRLEMLRIVNSMGGDEEFDEVLVRCAREYFLCGDQTTLLAKDGGRVVGCASVSYVTVMPTYDHPTGKRAHLMNVYTSKEYRRQGIARKMVLALIDEAKGRGCTEMSLDATDEGVPLYRSLGFAENRDGMVLALGGMTGER